MLKSGEIDCSFLSEVDLLSENLLMILLSQNPACSFSPRTASSDFHRRPCPVQILLVLSTSHLKASGSGMMKWMCECEELKEMNGNELQNPILPGQIVTSTPIHAHMMESTGEWVVVVGSTSSNDLK